MIPINRVPGLWLLLATGLVASARAEPVRLASPGGNFALELSLGDGGRPTYRVRWRRREIIAPSGLGFVLDGEIDWTSGFGSMTPIAQSESDTSWKPVWGERATIPDRHRGVTVLYSRQNPPAELKIEARAYDEGVAFRYVIEKGPAREVRLLSEQTEFRFTGDHDVWAVTSAQGQYSKVKLSEAKHNLERPCVLETADDEVIAIAEAALVDYARLRVRRSETTKNSLVSRLHGPVVSKLPLTTPWRVVMAGDTAGELLENNYLILNLNEPSRLADTSWIRPGKVIRDVSLSTEGGKACVDFAVRYGLQYIEYDAGWYGDQGKESSDARTVSRRGLDLEEVLRYAKEHGIGVWLYVNRRHLESQLDELLPLYRSWGVAGIKYGFVQHGSQKWTSWMHDAIRKTAEHRMLVDVHDEYRMTGWERTYPNFMTAEGIGGDETRPPHEQALANLFTRMIAGPADHTFCYYNGYVDQTSSHASQLAKSVCFFSPIQFLFWYDRPAAAQDEPELEFWKHLPTTWDETKVLHSKIGAYAVIARRRGEDWFVGCLNAVESRTFDVSLDFLPAGRSFVAHIYRDDETVPTRTRVGIERRNVDSKAVVSIALGRQGGVAMRIVRAETAGAFEQRAPPRFWRDLQFDEAGNPVFQAGGDPERGEILFAVEIPKGETRKFELRTATGQVILDRVLCPRPIPGTDRVVHAYPVHYGIASGLFNVDGDPLDIVVVGNDAVYEEQIRSGAAIVPRPVRVIGLLRMDECEDPPCVQEGDWLRDWKVVAVDPADPEYASTVELVELPDLVEELSLFFSSYKGAAGDHPRTRVAGFLDRESAVEHLKSFEARSPVERGREIGRCRALYRTLLSNAATLLASGQPERNDAFLDCLPCVFSPEFFTTEATYDFFIRYAAYQLLVGKLDQESVTLDTALERMASLKARGETHYRFVGYDLPEPATGHAIFEWVKTRNRNAGCAADFPPQHYESTPIAESWESLLAGADGGHPRGASPAPVDALPYGKLANRLVERALARLLQRMELFHEGILPHEIKRTENRLRKQILYLRTHLDLFSFAFPMCGTVRPSLVVDCGDGDIWTEVRDDLDEGYEHVGAFKDIYDGVSEDIGKDEDEQTITLGDYRHVYDATPESGLENAGIEAEISRQRRVVDRWIRRFRLRLERYRSYLEFHRTLCGLPTPQLENRRQRTDLSRLYWGRVAVLPDPRLSGYDNVRQLAFVLLTDVANSDLLQTVPAITDLIENGEPFHDLRKRIRAVVSLPELDDFAGLLLPEDLESESFEVLTTFVKRYGDLNDRLVMYEAFHRRWNDAASLEERRVWAQKMMAVRARIDAEWREVGQWQKEAELPRHLIDVAVRFVRRRS